MTEELTNMQNQIKEMQIQFCYIFFEERYIGRLAQLVQSICLTSRGSAVRIRQRPLYTESLQNISVRIFFFCTLPDTMVY